MKQLKMKPAVSILLCFLCILSPFSPMVMADRQKPRTIVFLGNSLTAGYGVDAHEAFPSLIQQRIDARGWGYRVVNAGQSGDTTSGGLQRLDWLMRVKIDILVLGLGINDGLRGIPVEMIRKNLQSIIERTWTRYPDARIVLAGMKVPPNMGRPYADRFAAIYPDLAQASGVRLIPFLLEGVGGNPELNLPDGIHPTAEGYKIIAENVWRVLEPMLEPPSEASVKARKPGTGP